MVSNETLRRNARNQLGNGIFKKPWLNMLVACLIPSAISGLMSAFQVAWLSFLVTYPLSYGLARVCIRVVESKKWSFDNLFDGFKEKFGQSVALGILQAIFLTLWSILFLPVGIVKTYSYAMSYYISQDKSNDYSANECITKSRAMMNGYKWQLFCLDFSFIGWYLLGLLCLGVGVLFVQPYHQLARANFYEALKAGENYTEREEEFASDTISSTDSDYGAFFDEAGYESETVKETPVAPVAPVVPVEPEVPVEPVEPVVPEEPETPEEPEEVSYTKNL